MDVVPHLAHIHIVSRLPVRGDVYEKNVSGGTHLPIREVSARAAPAPAAPVTPVPPLAAAGSGISGTAATLISTNSTSQKRTIVAVAAWTDRVRAVPSVGSVRLDRGAGSGRLAATATLIATPQPRAHRRGTTRVRRHRRARRRLP